MSSVKTYTELSEDLSPLIQGEGFCTDMVRYSDYAALEAKCAALAAENAKKSRCLGFFASVIKSGETWTRFCQHEYNEAQETPDTDAFLAEVRAQGADECVRKLVISDDDDFSDAPNVCAMVAHQLRQGGAAQ